VARERQALGSRLLRHLETRMILSESVATERLDVNLLGLSRESLGGLAANAGEAGCASGFVIHRS
jgi:hypothetical protein